MTTFDEYLGVISRSHGLDGTMVLTDVVVLPRPIVAGDAVAVGYSREFTKTFRVDHFESTPFRTTLRLREITTAESVTPLIDQAVYVQAADVGIDATRRYRIGEIEGCAVLHENGTTIGIISDVWLMPANDVWVVTTSDGKTIPLPVIDDVILSVDLEHRAIRVRLLPGLEDINTTSSEPDDV